MLSKRIKSEDGNSLVENVIILPLIFLCIYFIILGAFVIHDKITLDAAVERGAVYAAKCIADPFYNDIVNDGGSTSEILDANISDVSSLVFDTKGKVKPYRYLFATYKNELKNNVKNTVMDTISATKIPWRKIDPDAIECKVNNYVVYQRITVEATATYPLPKLFGVVGLPTEFEYTATSVTNVNDPDEFIRNVDFVVDVIADVNSKVRAENGGNPTGLDKIRKMLSDFEVKIKDSGFAKFLKMD